MANLLRFPMSMHQSHWHTVNLC